MSDAIQKIFSKFIAFILAVITSLMGTTTDVPELRIKENVTTSTDIVSVEVINYTGEEVTTGNYFIVEKKDGEQWVKLDFKDDYAVTDMAYIIKNRSTAVFKFSFVNAFGKPLDAGEYRIGKSFGEKVSYATFTVTQA